MNQHPPLKWRKYLLLARYELTTSDRLSREVRRFSWRDRFDLVSYLSRRFEASNANREELLIVVKFVEPEAVGALPNFRMRDASTVPALVELIQRSRGDFTEIWCCETRVQLDRLSVAGRILFQDGQGEVGQRVEQVWRASPRMIEELMLGQNDTALPFSYVRARRPSWQWHFDIEYLHRVAGSRSSPTVEQEFRSTMALVERQRSRVERFVDMVHGTGASAVSLEYKAEGDSLWFIDWDTAADRQILSRVFNERTSCIGNERV